MADAARLEEVAAPALRSAWTASIHALYASMEVVSAGSWSGGGDGGDDGGGGGAAADADGTSAAGGRLPRRADESARLRTDAAHAEQPQRNTAAEEQKSGTPDGESITMPQVGVVVPSH